MTPPEDHRRRLARLMEDRRAQLGLFWRDVAETAGLTTEGLRRMREGSKDIRPTTKAGVERALRWAYGSIDAILAGGDPTPAEVADEPERPPVREPDELDQWLERDPEARAALRALLRRMRGEPPDQADSPKRDENTG